MANLILGQQKVWFGGYDLTGSLNAVAVDHGMDIKENSTFGDTTRSYIPGVKSVAAQIEGLFDAAASDKPLNDQLGLSGQPLSFAAVTAVDGGLAYTFRATQGSYQFGAAHGEELTFSANASAEGLDLARGTIMHDAVRTASGNGVARQLGVLSATQKLHAALHVHAVSGTTPTLDVDIESDDASGFASPVTRLSFAQKTAKAGEYLTLNGPVTDDYWRAAFTIGGTAPSFTFTLILAIR